MAGSSHLVKELREKTGAGILDCQKALTETHVRDAAKASNPPAGEQAPPETGP